MEYNSWEKKEDLENTKEVVAEFKRRISTEGRRSKGGKRRGKREERKEEKGEEGEDGGS